MIDGADPGVSLRYGDSYEFRVRLVDHTGGGPALDEDPVNPAPQPVAPLTFLRWVRPQPLLVDTTLPVIPDPANAPDTITIHRPLMGYPEYVFAGGSAADLLADLTAARAKRVGPWACPTPTSTRCRSRSASPSPASRTAPVTTTRCSTRRPGRSRPAPPTRSS